MFDINRPITIEDLQRADETLKKLFQESPIPSAVKVNLETMRELDKLPSTTLQESNYYFSGVPIILDDTVNGWKFIY